jgi:hypothetical protein
MAQVQPKDVQIGNYLQDDGEIKAKNIYWISQLSFSSVYILLVIEPY